MPGGRGKPLRARGSARGTLVAMLPDTAGLFVKDVCAGHSVAINSVAKGGAPGRGCGGSLRGLRFGLRCVAADGGPQGGARRGPEWEDAGWHGVLQCVVQFCRLAARICSV